MKASEIREMGDEEKLQKTNSLKEELFNLHFQHQVSSLENPRKIRQIKSDIARIKTIIKESTQYKNNKKFNEV
jgi:large subunit ribosomal protein L29